MVRIVAVLVLALLGAPVVMHVILHDLHDHHEERASAADAETGAGDHEHPIVSSAAQQVPSHTRIALPVTVETTMTPTTWMHIATANRNVLSFGALRMDDDVGLHSLHGTFLI